MKRALFEIVENKKLTQNVFEMKLVGDTSAIQAPGQFLNIALDGFYLRRPISVCDVNGDEVTILYKVVGRGTAAIRRRSKKGRLISLPDWEMGLARKKAGNPLSSLAGAWAFRRCTCCAKGSFLKGKSPRPFWALIRAKRCFSRAVPSAGGRGPGDDGGWQFRKERLCDGRPAGKQHVFLRLRPGTHVKGGIQLSQRRAGSSALKSGWAAASAPVWGVLVKQSTAINASAKTGLF